MKKILLFGLLLVFAIGLQAQDKTAKFKRTFTYASLSFDSADTINASETYDIQIETNKSKPLTQSMRIKLDSIAGTPTCDVELYGKEFSSDSWTQVGSTVAWTGTTSDTTIHILNTTANRYRFYRTLVTSDATEQTTQVSEWEFKVREE